MADQDISSLAAENKGSRAGRDKAFKVAIPIWIVLIILMTGAIVAIVAPMGTIFVGTSRHSVNDLSTITIQVAVAQAAQGIETAISNTARVLDQAFAQPYFPNDFFGNQGNVYGSATLVSSMLKNLRSFDYISAMICATGGPVSVGPFGPFTNNTSVQALYTPVMSPVPGKKHTMVIYADWSTAGTNQLRVYGPDESTIVSSMMAGPKTIAGKNDFLYSNLMDPNPPQNPYFAMSFFNGSGVSFWQMSCYRLYYPTNSSRPTIGCSIGYVIDESLVPFLNSVRVTNNTIVLLLEKATGLLVSTNRRDSIAFNNTIRVTPNLSLNKDVSILGRGLLAHFGNFSLIPNDTAGNGAVWQRKMEDGQEWFLSTAIINVRGTEFVLAIGFPRSDMFSKIDSAERQGLIIAISVAVAGLLLTGSLTFLALRPLHKMAIAMKQLTKFDFSSLENGALEKRSLMSEIREVESVFDTMVVAFASAIKRNKQLVGNTAVSSTGQKSSMMNSTSK